MAWNGAGGWLIFSQTPQVNFSRTVSITFHWRGTASRVSGPSPPILPSRSEPQQVQVFGAATTTRSRGRSAGNGLRLCLRRVNERHVVPPPPLGPTGRPPLGAPAFPH